MKPQRQIILIAHNLRSCHNVGSLLRTAEGLGVSKVFLTGYTPYPLAADDSRLPHLAKKIAKDIHKTALGAEDLVAWEHSDDILDTFSELRADGYKIFALEQTSEATSLREFDAPAKLALVVGREVEGLEAEVIKACDGQVEIPMSGKKESFNVVQAAAMAMYECIYH